MADTWGYAQHSGAHCKDVRDKVFGFLRLAKMGNQFGVDYNMKVSEVLWSTLKFCTGTGPIADLRFSRSLYGRLFEILTLTERDVFEHGSSTNESIIIKSSRVCEFELRGVELRQQG
jgi:hypothetical protein